MLIATIAISLITLNTSNVTAIEELDGKNPHTDEKYWDFDRGSIVAWHVAYLEGSNHPPDGLIIYNITGAALIPNATGENYYCYGIQLIEMKWEGLLLKERTDVPVLNTSLINYTVFTDGRMYPYKMGGTGIEGILANPFIPKNSSNDLDLHNCSSLLKWGYWFILNGVDFVDVNMFSREIFLENSSFGSYARMIYLPNGTLKTGELRFKTPSEWMTINYTRVFDPNPPEIHGVGNYWDFGIGDVVGWRTTYSGDFDEFIDIRGSENVIFKINRTGLLYNQTWCEENPVAEYHFGVSLQEMYYKIIDPNTGLGDLQEYTNRTIHPLVNVSLTNFTLDMPHFPGKKGMMQPCSPAIPGPYTDLNLFIQKNNTGKLDLHWSAEALYWYYNGRLTDTWDTPLSDLSVNNFTHSIHYSYNEFYCDLFYYPNGTLRTGEIYAPIGPMFEEMTINYTRIFDFYPQELKIDWSNDFDEPGEIGYFGVDIEEYKVEFWNITYGMVMEQHIEEHDGRTEYFERPMYYQEIWAKQWDWDNPSEKWVWRGMGVCARANKYMPLFFLEEEDSGLPIFLIPNGTKHYELSGFFWWMVYELDEVNRLSSGDLWVRLYHTSTENFMKISYRPDGILEYAYSDGVPFFGDPDNKNTLIYMKDNWVLTASIPNRIDFGILDVAGIHISVNISVWWPMNFSYSGFPYNPTEKSIDNDLAFFDIMVTNKSRLVQPNPINITISYDIDKYEDLKVWYFNYTLGPNGEWQQVEFIELGDGVIIIMLDHASIYAITGIKVTSSDPGDDDTGDIDEYIEELLKEEIIEMIEIPFGNYYLVFMAIGIISLVAYYKKRKL